MIGKNRQLVTDDPVEFEKQPVEAQDCSLPDHCSCLIETLFRSDKRILHSFNQSESINSHEQTIYIKNMLIVWREFSQILALAGTPHLEE